MSDSAALPEQSYEKYSHAELEDHRLKEITDTGRRVVMDSLLQYGSESENSDDDPPSSRTEEGNDQIPLTERTSPIFPSVSSSSKMLPPPPDDLLTSFSATNSIKAKNESLHGGRIRSFPHVEGNFALHVYIPVILPLHVRDEVVPSIEKALQCVHGLQLSEEGYTQESKGPGLKLSGEYHISLSRTVAVRINQIESIAAMLRHRFSNQKTYRVEFGSWEVFVNDERTRTFLSLEITTAGTSEIQQQVSIVDAVFGIYHLPAFYTNPRPHISLAWAVGEVSSSMKTVCDALNKVQAGSIRVASRRPAVWSLQVKKIECKIGQRIYPVWASP